MYYAEFNTDQYIRETFFPDLNYKGIMVEVGAGPTVFYSMSKHFRETGWRCICIEPNPYFVEKHLTEGNEIYQFACSYEEKESTFKVVKHPRRAENTDGFMYSSIEIKYEMPDYKITEIPVKITKLNTLLSNLFIEKVDFVSVDTEGWELETLMGFNLKKYQPKVVLLENYTDNQDYSKYMEEYGYSLNTKIEYNYIFYKNNF